MTAQFDATLCDEVNWRALCSASNFKAYFQKFYIPFEFRAVTHSPRVVHNWSEQSYIFGQHQHMEINLFHNNMQPPLHAYASSDIELRAARRSLRRENMLLIWYTTTTTNEPFGILNGK